MSKVMIVKCDRCGAEITDKYTYKLWPQVTDLDGDVCQTQPFEGELQRDYCADCLEVALDFLHTAPAEELPPPPNVKKEPVKKIKKPQKKELDMGKVLALRKAGWTNAKIADEMGVSEATLYARLKEYTESKLDTGCKTAG